MHVLILSELNNPHTIKWVDGLQRKGVEISVFGLLPVKTDYYESKPNIKVYNLDLGQDLFSSAPGSLKKVKYLNSVSYVKKLIREIKPDIVHAHFASSYGLIGALAGFHPYVLSVWGKDIYVFPEKSILHKKIIQYNISKSDALLSTSHVMADVTRKYTNKKIDVTPFGINLNIFKPQDKPDNGKITIGLLKALEVKYGVNYLIDAFAEILKKYPEKSFELLVVGDGTQKENLEKQASELGIAEHVTFTGRIEFMKVQEFHNKMDIEVYPSIEDSESFGVSIVEAGACGNPVIVSNVGGLPEVVADEETGIVIEEKNTGAIVSALSRFIDNPELIKTMGAAGRKRVEENYNLEDNLQQMIDIYTRVLS